MVHLSKALSLLRTLSLLLHTCHILIVSSFGQTVNRFCPSGPRQLCVTGPKWAVSVSRRFPEGYSWTAMEFMRGVATGFSGGRGVGGPDVEVRVGRAGGSNDEPCVLRSSLQWGDQCSESTDVFKGMVSSGVGDDDGCDALQMRILPSGYMLPVARRSGFHGHHASACRIVSDVYMYII